MIFLFTISVGYYYATIQAVFNSPSGERELYSHENVTDILLFLNILHIDLQKVIKTK